MKNLKPITRREMFMAKAAGQDVTPPEPITREEMFLSDIAEHEEGQGGGGGGSLCVAFSSEDQGQTWVSDKTFAEINTAISDGAWVYAIANGEDVYQLSGYDGRFYFSFAAIYIEGGVIRQDIFVISSDDSVELYSSTFGQ